MAVFLLGDPVPPPRAWLLGLAENPKAPVPVVLWLLDHDPEHIRGVVRRRLADEVVVESRMLGRELAERLAAHAEARVRGYVAGNPHLPADLVRTLATDEDPRVRRAAATHPALSEEERSAIEFEFEFDPSVRYRLHRGAAADPRLPLEILLGLLDDDKLAEHAASNPALPVDTMHEFLNRAGAA
ncbi:hypothetical protein [Actinomadura sp. 3N508]|uniref:hypothetical protein n=1 Tax=Actinomadura sp. 3N508 TaxID=3375153 RepID=UPI0037ACB2B9